MRNLRLTIAYQGGAYSGWQIQPLVPTVQGTIEKQLQQMTGEPCRLRSAGRTDAGVHAQGQVANVLTESSISLRGFFRGLNALLPDDISILSVEEVSESFDARRHNHGKHYRYSIWNTRPPNPRLAATSHHVHGQLDLDAMALAGWSLVGTHDFASFRAATCDRETTVRTIYRCTVSAEGPLVQIHVEGTAFLKNMVRIISGTLIEVGSGKRAPFSMTKLLNQADRTKAGITAPAHGLCLMRVFL
jgi:tRNA pseudouridine38-40 synthase